MSFKRIEKARPTQRNAFGCSMAVTTKNSNFRLRILFRKDVLEKASFKVGDCVNCFIGREENSGTLLVQKGSDFKIGGVNDGEGHIHIIPFDNIPLKLCSLSQAKHCFSGDDLILTIPKLTPKREKTCLS